MVERVHRFLIPLLTVYGAITLLFNAWTTGAVFDEPAYIEFGLQFLRENRLPSFFGHPPLSLSMGAIVLLLKKLIPSMNDAITFWSRTYHIVLYVLSGYCISKLLIRKINTPAGLLFAALYFCFPSLKAMASLHLTDADPGAFAALAGCVLWSADLNKSRNVLLAFLLAGFALFSKTTACLFLPFFAYVYCRKRSLDAPLQKKFLLIVSAVLFAGALAYQFRWEGFAHYFQVFSDQIRHRQGGHPASFLGNISRMGVWYYYLVVCFFKTPLPILILFALALSHFFKNQKYFDDFNFLFFYPAIALFIFLCANTVQIGFRYFAPGLMLLLVFVSVKAAVFFRSHRLVWCFLALLIGIDFHTLLKDTYLSYFNFLTPKPSWNFSDSNNDWGQGIPKHLKKRVPVSLYAGDYLDFLTDPKRNRAVFQIGATELNFIWGHPVAANFRALKPIQSTAGHEFFDLSKAELFQILKSRQSFSAYETTSFKVLDAEIKDLKKSPLLCPNSDSAQLEVVDLFKNASGALPDVLLSLGKDATTMVEPIQTHLKQGQSYVIVVDSNVGLETEIENTRSTYDHPQISLWLPLTHWFSFSPNHDNPLLRIKLKMLGNPSPKDRKARVLAFSWKCPTT